MKSAEVYRELRTVFAPLVKSEGFKRATGGMLGWYRSREPMHTVFWFQCSQNGWDPDRGSQFTLEFQESTEIQPGSGSRRSRFGKLLMDDDWRRLPELQNEVICKLRRPGRNQWIQSLDPQTRQWYLDSFELRTAPYSKGEDVWMRYHSRDDVLRWAEFLARAFLGMVSRFEDST